ncbi:uncharacterized protein LOC114318961 [Camellia sinensis]|uniref:uncharacterized protein LOC114318961 n=1 Tax=Camellia sinensis TaxID=4442 RepID=UPI00103629B5|nr:uncharacterized protein LOC114318961 [Camellia sinensis]
MGRRPFYYEWKPKCCRDGDGFMFFIFDTPECCRDVLEGGPWYIGGYLLILKQWKRMMKLAKEKSTKIPIWVKFFNVPLEYWDPDGLSRIASAIGNPLFMDQLTARGSRVAFARICVEIEATSKLLSYFQIRCGDDAVLIKAEYQGLPSVCQHCQIFGHSTEKCVSKQVAQLISLQKVTEENVNPQEEGWTTVQAKGKRKVGDPELETIPEVVESPETDTEPIPTSVVEPQADSVHTQVIQEDPAGKSSSVEEVSYDSSDVDIFQKKLFELTELVIPNAAEMIESALKEVKKSPTVAQVNQHIKNKSSGKGSSSQRKKKK